MASLKLASAAMALLLLFSSAASGQGGQLFLNVYVDDTPGKALVVGNVDDITGLSFLNTSDKIYEDNGQIYAVCDSLVEKDDDGWRLSFPASGYYNEYHAVFLVSGGFAFREINCTEGLELLSTAHNGSIVLDVQGFDLTDPAVNFSYAAS
ncbi:MAG: hypothetical protein LUO89_15410 [Methanothrix sp.]|nr:hypothetical protein [Methanothrix sp.]